MLLQQVFAALGFVIFLLFWAEKKLPPAQQLTFKKSVKIICINFTTLENYVMVTFKLYFKSFGENFQLPTYATFDIKLLVIMAALRPLTLTHRTIALVDPLIRRGLFSTTVAHI